MSFQAAETVAVLASTVAIVIGLFVLFEKVSGVTGRWAARQIAAGVTPMQDHLETQIGEVSATSVKAHTSIKETLDDMQEYNRYHLGPNHTTTPVHERIIALEAGLKAMMATEKERRKFQEFVDRVGQDIRGTQDPDEELEG